MPHTLTAQAVGDEALWLVFQPVQQPLEETLGRSGIPAVLHKKYRARAGAGPPPASDSAARHDPDEHLVEVPDVSGPGPPSRSRLAKSAPNFRHQCRMLSCVTTMPRSAVSQIVPRLPNPPIEVRDSAGLRSLLFGLRVL